MQCGSPERKGGKEEANADGQEQGDGSSTVTKPPALPHLSGTPVRRPKAPAPRWPVLPGCCGQDTQRSVTAPGTN